MAYILKMSSTPNPGARRHFPRAWRLWGWGVVVSMVLPLSLLAANVTINATNKLSTVADAAFGLHTSVYDNQHGNAALPGRLIESGVNTLRYPGGGYADIYHWSVNKNSPWFGNTNDFGYIAGNTDFGHFVQLLSNAQAQAVITINYGSGLKWNAGHTQLVSPATNGTPQEAAAWVAYANASTNLYGSTNDITIGTDALGNDWKTAGYWAKLRTSTPLGSDDGYNFLRINRVTPVGIKYWEIGNETFGTGFYDDSDGYSVNYAVPYDATTRLGNTNLSPTFYGQQVNAFAAAMKAIDPTIKTGAVVTTPPGDYSWDSYHGQRWSAQVLQRCATNIDFIIAHWYPYIGEYTDGSNLLAAVRTTLPIMINGATTNLDFSTSAGLRDWINLYRPADGTNVQMFITEFGYFGSLTNMILGPATALFAGDCYATWMDLGVANVDFLEMSKTPFLGDSASLNRGGAFYAIQMVRKMAGPKDALVAASSDQNLLRAHAAMQQGGKLALLLINEDLTNSQTVNVTVTNASLASAGTRYQFGKGNFSGVNEIPSSAPSTNAVSGLGNSFSVTVPAFTMMVVTIPLTNTAPSLATMSNWIVNAGQTVAFTASATDMDSPPQTLVFSLLSAPTNATLNASSGAFAWRPLVAQANTTNLVTLKVADNGTPGLSATQNFSVVVNPIVSPRASAALGTNGQLVLTFNGVVGPDYAVQTSTNLVDWQTVFVTNPPVTPFNWTDTVSTNVPMRFYRAVLGPPWP